MKTFNSIFISGVLLFALFISSLSAQQINTELTIKTLFSSGAGLPFWMTSNQNGIFDRESSGFQYVDLSVNPPLTRDYISYFFE